MGNEGGGDEPVVMVDQDDTDGSGASDRPGQGHGRKGIVVVDLMLAEGLRQDVVGGLNRTRLGLKAGGVTVD